MLVVKTTSPATSPSPAKLHPSKTAPSSRTTVARLRPYSKLRSRPVMYKLSTNYSTHRPTRQSPPEVRGVRRPAQERLPAHRPPLREVHQREVRWFSGRDSTSFTHPAPRRAAHRLDEPRERDPTPENQLRVERCEGRLVSEETRRCLLEGQLLLLGGVRRVIRRHEIEDALTQGLDNPLAIFFRPEGWVYPVHPIERGDQAVRQRQVVRRGIRGDVRPIFEEPDEGRRKSGRDVGYVDLRPRLGREHERRGRRRVLGAGRRARDPGKRGIDPVVHDARGERVVLAVQDHGQPRRTRVEHPIAQHARRSRPEPVVRDAERAGLLEQAHLREALAFEPRVHGGGDVGPHPGLFLDAAADAEPLSTLSSSSRPGVRQWACTSTKPGKRWSPSASSSRVPRSPSPISATRPPRMRTSAMPSRPLLGSRMYAWRITSSAGVPLRPFKRQPRARLLSRARGPPSGRGPPRRPGPGSGTSCRGRRRRRSRPPC